MANRQWARDYAAVAKDLVQLNFSFIANNTANPVFTYATGTLLRGSGVASVLRTGFSGAAAGIFQVTLDNNFRYVVSHDESIDDLAIASDDGAYATLGNILNEGTSSAIVFNLFTRAATGTKTDYTSRRVCFNLVLKNGLSGT